MLKRVTRIHLAVAAIHRNGAAPSRRKDLARYFREVRQFAGRDEGNRRYRTMYGPLLPLE